MEPPAEARGPQPVVLGGQTYPHGEASTASSADSSRVLQVVPLHRVDFDPLWFRLLFYPQSCASLTVNTGDWRAVPLKPSIFGRQRVRCFVVPKMMEGDNACVITSPFEATIFLDPRSNIQQLVNTSAASILYVNALNLDGTSRAPESVVHPQMSRALYPGCYSLVTDGTSPVHVVAAACEYRSPTIMKPDIVRVEGTRRPHMPRQPLHRDVAALSRPGAPAAIFPALRQTKTLAIIRRASVEPDPSNNRVLTVREGDGQQHAVTMLQNLITTPGTQVWEARHPCYRESVVVIKKIRPLPGVTPGSSNVRGVITVEHQVHREIKFASMVEIFGENTEVDALYLEDVPALHLAEGDWLSQGSCFQGTMDDARTIISDMASALMYLRTMSIRHNNIRPSCILYSREIGAKLTDFDDATRNGEPATLSGTAWYVPPEWMAIGERRESGDVWALGIIMLYLMRRIPLPESERQVKAWDIKQLRGREAGRGAARRLMSRWLQIVRHEVEKLKDFQDEAKWMAETTQRMLHPVVSLRITGSELAMMLAEDDVARGQWGGR